jgi:hypothetical protein
VSKGRWAVPGYKVRFLDIMDSHRMYTNNPTGEVRRSVRPLSIFFPCNHNVPDLGCITYVFVNSSGEWKCILDSDHLLLSFLSLRISVQRLTSSIIHQILVLSQHLDFKSMKPIPVSVRSPIETSRSQSALYSATPGRQQPSWSEPTFCYRSIKLHLSK